MKALKGGDIFRTKDGVTTTVYDLVGPYILGQNGLYYTMEQIECVLGNVFYEGDYHGEILSEDNFI